MGNQTERRPIHLNGTADGIGFDHADCADALISFEGRQPVIGDPRVRLETADTLLNFKGQGTKLILQYFGPRLGDPLDTKPANQNAYPTTFSGRWGGAPPGRRMAKS